MKKTAFVLMLLVLISIAPISVYRILNQRRLSIVANNRVHEINISDILSKDVDKIRYISDFYLDDNFIGLECLVDSIIYVKVIKIGTTNNLDISKFLFIDKNKPSETFSLNSYNLTVNEYQLMHEWYNISELGQNRIDKIVLYNPGQIIFKRAVKSNLYVFETITSAIGLRINNDRIIDFEMLGANHRCNLCFWINGGDVYFIYTNLQTTSSNNLKIEWH